MENKSKTLLVGLIVVFVIFIVFLSTIYTHYIRSHKSPVQQQDILEKERVDVTLEYIPQIDWADMALYFNISNMRAQTRKIRGPLLGSVKLPTMITFDIEAKETLKHPLFLAHFLDSEGRDVLRSKPVQLEPAKEEVISLQWKPGNKGAAYFIVDKEKLSLVKIIKIKRRIKD